MRTDWMRLGLLAGVMLLGTGASPEGVEQARRWQYEADLARAGSMDEVAYARYEQIHRAFAGTRHGEYAGHRMAALQRRISWPRQAPDQENAGSLLAEVFDFFVWP